jgi:hypothetical protein
LFRESTNALPHLKTYAISKNTNIPNVQRKVKNTRRNRSITPLGNIKKQMDEGPLSLGNFWLLGNLLISVMLALDVAHKPTRWKQYLSLCIQQ